MSSMGTVCGPSGRGIASTLHSIILRADVDYLGGDNFWPGCYESSILLGNTGVLHIRDQIGMG